MRSSESALRVRRAGAGEVALHPAPRLREEILERTIVQGVHPREGVRAAQKEHLRLVDVADARHRALQEQRLGQRQVRDGADPTAGLVEIEVRREDVGTEAAEHRVARELSRP